VWQVEEHDSCANFNVAVGKAVHILVEVKHHDDLFGSDVVIGNATVMISATSVMSELMKQGKDPTAGEENLKWYALDMGGRIQCSLFVEVATAPQSPQQPPSSPNLESTDAPRIVRSLKQRMSVFSPSDGYHTSLAPQMPRRTTLASTSTSELNAKISATSGAVGGGTSYSRGTLTVEVLRATCLKEKQMLGSQAPYAMVTLLPSQTSKRTLSVSGGGTTPTWTGAHENEMAFKLSEGEKGASELLLEVWSDNLAMDEIIGSCKVQLPANKELFGEATWYKLDAGGWVDCNLSFTEEEVEEEREEEEKQKESTAPSEVDSTMNGTAAVAASEAAASEAGAAANVGAEEATEGDEEVGFGAAMMQRMSMIGGTKLTETIATFMNEDTGAEKEEGEEGGEEEDNVGSDYDDEGGDNDDNTLGGGGEEEQQQEQEQQKQNGESAETDTAADTVLSSPVIVRPLKQRMSVFSPSDGYHTSLAPQMPRRTTLASTSTSELNAKISATSGVVGGGTSYSRGTLTVEVLRATCLKEKQMLGSQAPYAMVTLLPSQTSKRTLSVSGGGTTPTWTGAHENEMAFKLSEGEKGASELLLEVWSDNLAMDEIIGSCKVQLPANKELFGEATWYKLDAGGWVDCNLSFTEEEVEEEREEEEKQKESTAPSEVDSTMNGTAAAVASEAAASETGAAANVGAEEATEDEEEVGFGAAMMQRMSMIGGTKLTETIATFMNEDTGAEKEKQGEEEEDNVGSDYDDEGGDNDDNTLGGGGEEEQQQEQQEQEQEEQEQQNGESAETDTTTETVLSSPVIVRPLKQRMSVFSPSDGYHTSLAPQMPRRTTLASTSTSELNAKISATSGAVGGGTSYSRGTLTVEVLRATCLKEKQMLGSQAPYAMVTLLPSQTSKRTLSVSGGGTTPTWTGAHENEMAFKLSESEKGASELLLEVWSDNLAMDEIIGSCKVQLPANKELFGEATWYKLDAGGWVDCNVRYTEEEAGD
jgi:hypothetical protein